MSRQLEAKQEARRQKQDAAVLLAVYGGLEDAVSHAGGELTGLAIKWGSGDVLFVVKAILPGGPMVGFVGASDLSAGLVKVQREAQADRIRWKQDQWARE